MQFGLVGEDITHSLSPYIQGCFGLPEYGLLSLASPQLEEFFARRDFTGVNVTMPYKRRAARCCDVLDTAARRTGVVNTVVNRQGRLYGHNTDYQGFLHMARRAGVSFAGRRVMILGTGATSATVACCVRDEGAKQVVLVGREASDGVVSYQQAANCRDIQVLVNTTPVGMWPQAGAMPLDPALFSGLCAVLDVVYDPFATGLCQAARQQGVAAVGGLSMLVAQGFYAAQLFMQTSLPPAGIDAVYQSLVRRQANITLIGMPGVGKSVLGSLLARRLGRPLADTDHLARQRLGTSIETAFARQGEEAFRVLEEELVLQVGAAHGQVVATGGGTVLRRRNVEALRQNGPLIFISCPPQELSLTKGRPLAKTRQDIQRLWQQRLPIYRAAADCTVRRGSSTEETLGAIESAFGSWVNAQ